MVSVRFSMTYTWLLLVFDACSAHEYRHDLVDQIWYASQRSPSSSLDQVVYVVSSHNAAASNSLFAPFAELHASNQAIAGEAFHVCRQDAAADSTKSCSASDLSAHLVSSRYERKARLWNQTNAFFRDSAQYFIFIDFSNGWSDLTTDYLLEFQAALVFRQPSVAVPFHTCNAVHSSSGSIAAISSIYDTTFVAIHRSARKLLLPLDESLLSLVCHLFLQGNILQLNLTSQSKFLESDCNKPDVANQKEMMDFSTSLLTRQYLHALPFSPRIHAASLAAPVTFTENATISDSLHSGCFVRCDFAYWQHHPVFECCATLFESPTTNNPDSRHWDLWLKWQLPHPSTFLQKALQLTHPLPQFSIVLSGRQHILDDTCAHQDLVETSDALESFNMTVIPEKMDARSTGNSTLLSIQVQLTLSAPESEHELCAVFGRLDEIETTIICDATEYSSIFSGDNVSIISDISSAPWFYSPGPSWFQCTSSMLSDSLRTRSFSVSSLTQCSDIFQVSIRSKVSLRRLCSKAARAWPCIGSVLEASSQSVIYSAHHQEKESSYSKNTPPTDLFERPMRARAVDQDLFSDFSCAGPNRHWPHADESAHHGPAQLLKTGVFNMCLIQNACWIDKQIVVFLPEHFQSLEYMGFFDFPHVKLSEELTNVYYSPPSYSPLQHFFVPKFVYGRVPPEAKFAADIVHYALQRGFSGTNFGHTVWEDIGSIFHAVQTFDLPRDDGRIVLLTDHGKPRLFPPFFPRIPAYIDEFPNGTCFTHMVVGFAGIGSFEQGFSLHRSAHAVEFRKFYLSLLRVSHLTSKKRSRKQIIVNMYPKIVVGTGPVWSDVCKMSLELSVLYSNIQFRCISLHEMSLHLQAQVVSEATVHIWPNGTC